MIVQSRQIIPYHIKQYPQYGNFSYFLKEKNTHKTVILITQIK
jgi:hypothetical protein